MKYFNFLLFILLLNLTVKAQKDEDEMAKGPIVVTKVVLEAFLKSYPGITNATWNYGDGDYEVFFTMNGVDMTVDYNIYGQCEETETEIKTGELPQIAIDYLCKNYSSFVLTSASKIVTANYDVAYVAQIGKKGKFWDITFASDGKFLKEEESD
ncbi:MAG: hypothetical protein WCM93_05410 [Bacteroidota bacterium]